MAFPEAVRRVGLRVAHLSSVDMFHRERIRIGREGYLITCLKEPLPEGLRSIELGPKRDAVESIIWDPKRVRVQLERFNYNIWDKKSKKALDLQDRIRTIRRFTRGEKLLIEEKVYPNQAVLVRIYRQVAPDPETFSGDPIDQEPSTPSPAAGTSLPAHQR